MFVLGKRHTYQTYKQKQFIVWLTMKALTGDGAWLQVPFHLFNAKFFVNAKPQKRSICCSVCIYIHVSKNVNIQNQ